MNIIWKQCAKNFEIVDEDLEYGRDFDFSRDFDVQFRELYEAVPRVSLHTIGNENSYYSCYTLYLKNFIAKNVIWLRCIE